MKDAYNVAVVALLMAILGLQLYALLKKKENLVYQNQEDGVWEPLNW